MNLSYVKLLVGGLRDNAISFFAVGKLTKRAHFQFELVRINFVVIRFFVVK